MIEPIPPCDVAIVGGGLSGLLCALYLARSGVDVRVLDADPAAFGAGASSASLASLGLVMLGTSEHPHRLAHALGAPRAKEYLSFSQTSIALLAEEVTLERGGLRVGIGAENDELEHAVRVSQELGVESALWTPEEVAAELGCVGLGGARFVPLDARLDPAMAMAQLLRAAREAGVGLHPGCPVASVSSEDAVRLSVAGGTVTCELVVYAASWGLRAVDAWLADKIYPVRAAVLETAASARPALQGASAQYGYLSWQSAPSGGLRVSGARWATPHMETGETERVPGTKVQAALQGFLDKSFPEDARAGVVARRAGIQGYSCDNLPLVGPLPGGRRVACTGFGDSGWSMAAAAAQVVAQGILGERPDYPDFLKPQRLVGI